MDFGDCSLMHFQHQGSEVIFLLNSAVKDICVWRWEFASGSEKEGLVVEASWQSHIVRCRIASYWPPCRNVVAYFLKTTGF